MFFRKLKISTKKKHLDQFFFSMPKTYKYYFKKRNFYKNSRLLNRKNFLDKHFSVGFRSIENIYLTHNCMISCMKFFKRFSEPEYTGIDNFMYRVRVFPDFSLTSKPKEIRMGKGKGKVSKKIFYLKRGCIIFEFNYKGFAFFQVKALLHKCSMKLPVKSVFTKNFW